MPAASAPRKAHSRGAAGVGRAPAASASAASASAAPGAAHELKTLVLSRHPLIVVETDDEDRADAILRVVAADVRLALFGWTATTGLVRRPGTRPVDGTEDPGELVSTLRDLREEGLFVIEELAPLVARPEPTRALRDVLEAFARPGRRSTVVLRGARVELPPELEALAMRYELRLPDAAEYRRTVAAVIESLAAEHRARIELTASDYDDVAAAVAGLTLNQARQTVARVAIEEGRLARDDLARIAHLAAETLRDDGLLEYFPPADNLYELGGFAGLQRWLDRVGAASTPRAAEPDLAPPRGVLLVGVQGCGKSLAAKVIARRWEKPLLKLDAGRLYRKDVDESERSFRRAIATAEAMAPVVLWIDEIEKGMAPAGGDAAAGLSRLVGSFLTWMREKRADIFVVATANDLSIIPPEMLRKGRFDEIFFVDLPEAAEREEILRIHLRLRGQDPGALDPAPVVAASEGFSGAELEQAVVASVLRARHEDRSLDTALLVEEIRATVPLFRARREDVERLRAYAAGHFVPVA